MTKTAHELLTEALHLPSSDRGQLASSLIDSLDTHDDPDAQRAWFEEIERRLDEIDAGHVPLVPWPQARQMIRGQHGTEAG